jgi:hypothetical protein
MICGILRSAAVVAVAANAPAQQVITVATITVATIHPQPTRPIRRVLIPIVWFSEK